MNSKWQRLIKEEKERRRSVLINEPMANESSEKNDTDINELIGEIEESIPSSLANDDELLSCRRMIPVTKISVPSEISREQIAQQFTLNKNQKAAFSIITGHLDGLDKVNEGILIL